MKVYRVLRDDEDPRLGLRAKNPAATYTPEGHILHGSRPAFASQYISAMANVRRARRRARQVNARVVEIDLDKVAATVIDLSTPPGREAYLKGVMAKNFAQAASEVLIEGWVPPEAITLLRFRHAAG